MYIVGDIGNTETKFCLINSKDFIIKRINLPTNKISNKKLNDVFNKLIKNFDKVEKFLFCSVVPKSFSLIKKFLPNLELWLVWEKTKKK